VANRIKAAAPDRVGVIAGDLQDAESMKAALDLFTALGSPNIDCRQDGSALHPKYGRQSYLFNSTIAGIEHADAIMVIGSNPRKEAAIINARIRKRWLANAPVLIGVVGENADLNYDYNYLGAGADSLAKFAEHGPINKDRPMFIVGAGAVTGEAGAAVLALAAKAAGSMSLVRDGWNGWNVLHTAASRVGGLDMGFVPGEGGKTAGQMVGKGALDVLLLLGADEIDASASDAFTVYVGSHGDRGAARADVILPAAAYTEKSGIYVNTEGRVQLANRVVFPKGQAKEDWSILRALSEHLGQTLPYDSLEQLRAKLMSDHPTFGQVDYVAGHTATEGFDLSAIGEAGDLPSAPFRSGVEDFYMTNPIARASVTMAECSALHAQRPLMAAE